MNNSPEYLKSNILLMNSGYLDELNIIKIDRSQYISESDANLLMEECEITSKDELIGVLESILGINNLAVFDENAINSLTQFEMEVSLLEALNPREIEKAADGPSILSKLADRFSALIKKEKYDDAKATKKYIDKCDEALKEIEKEKKRLANGDKTSNKKFAVLFLCKILKTLVIYFIDLYLIPKLEIKKRLPNTVSSKIDTFENSKAGSKIAKFSNIYTLAIDIIDTLQNLYNITLSFADYSKLLNKYELEIRSTKEYLEEKLEKDNKNKSKEMKNMDMVKLTEDVTPDAVEVHYQTPEELLGTGKVQVVHDEDSLKDDFEDQNNPVTVTPGEDPYQNEVPYEDPNPDEFTPIDAVRATKANPDAVPVAKYANKYYIDHKDLQCYMDACGERNYDSAVDNIINYHNDPNFCYDSVRVIMGDNDMANLDQETKSAMESSSIQFEVYSSRY